jgi:hypothetical protein
MNLDAPTIVVPLTSLLMVHLLVHDHVWWLLRFFTRSFFQSRARTSQFFRLAYISCPSPGRGLRLDAVILPCNTRACKTLLSSSISFWLYSMLFDWISSWVSTFPGSVLTLGKPPLVWRKHARTSMVSPLLLTLRFLASNPGNSTITSTSLLLTILGTKVRSLWHTSSCRASNGQAYAAHSLPMSLLPSPLAAERLYRLSQRV